MGWQQGSPSQAGGSGVTQVAASLQALHRLSWLPAFSCLSKHLLWRLHQQGRLVKREEVKKKKKRQVL